jgi:hypothetical protein
MAQSQGVGRISVRLQEAKRGKVARPFEHGRPSHWDNFYSTEYTFGSPATQEQLASVERELGVRLPAEVRELLTEFNGVWETSEDSFRHGSVPDILVLDTECMTVSVPDYLRDWGDPPLTPSGTDLRQLLFVAQVNGFADLYGVCLEPVYDRYDGTIVRLDLDAGAVVKLDHETGELEYAFSNLKEFVEKGLK